jgi:hypothetical protein
MAILAYLMYGNNLLKFSFNKGRCRAVVKPVFHLRIFSREAKFFVFIQLVPDGSS